MRKASFFTIWMVAVGIAGAATCGGHGKGSTMLVTSKWLADHLNDPNLVVIGIGQKAEYDQGHIPGALFLDHNQIVLRIGPGQPNSFELPPMDQLAATFGALGVSNTSRVVLYMTKDFISATTRVYLTLDAMGLGAQTMLLDGGFSAWQKEGRVVTTEVRAPKAAKLEPCAQADVIADVEAVKASQGKAGVRVVDARTANFYSGETPGRNMRPGHIPGAASVPFLTLVDEATGMFKPADVLRKQFETAGVKDGDRVVSYCHIGMQATVVYFAARLLGHDARMYDGSFEEWSRHTELPVEKAEK
jgi:thiosulfate/3-mercaptopyruvate sulfurtransferase